MTELPDAETIKAFNKSIVDEFRANDGKVGGPFEGAALLLLTTTGAKSGQPRLAPLAYLTIDGKAFIIGSARAKAGAPFRSWRQRCEIARPAFQSTFESM